MKEYGIRVNQKVRRKAISPISGTKLRGDVCLQLFDEDGNVVAEEKSHNIVTNAVDDIFASNYLGTMVYEQLMPISKRLFGGVLCFKDAQTENADNYYLPNDNEIIAHAGQDNQYYDTSIDSKMGTYNNNESGVITNGYKHVWDFAASQGNGTISSLSLCHEDLGSYGLDGVDLTTSHNPTFLPLENFVYANERTGMCPSGTTEVRQPVFFDTANDIAYKLVPSGTTLSIWALNSYAALSGVGLNQESSMTNPSENAMNTKTDITLPYNAHLHRYLFVPESREIHCLYPSGNTIYRTIIDLTDMSTTTSNMTVSGANMSVFTNGNGGDVIPITLDIDGYLYLVGTNIVYKIKYSDPTQVTSVSVLRSVNGWTSGTVLGVGHCGVHPASGVIIRGNAVHYGKTKSLYDTSWDSSRMLKFTQIDNQLVFFSPTTRTNASGSSAQATGTASCFSKLFLSTIFNLQTPVVKQSTQTMKITYTITEVAA